jgi:hypothetical protein
MGGGGGGEAETIKRLDEACNYCTIVINMDLLHETVGLFLRTGLRCAFASKRPDIPCKPGVQNFYIWNIFLCMRWQNSWT